MYFSPKLKTHINHVHFHALEIHIQLGTKRHFPSRLTLFNSYKNRNLEYNWHLEQFRGHEFDLCTPLGPLCLLC